MEWVEKFGAAGAFLLVVIRMILDARRPVRASQMLDELQRLNVTPERMARLMNDLERRFDILPTAVLKERSAQVAETHQNVRDIVRFRDHGGGGP